MATDGIDPDRREALARTLVLLQAYSLELTDIVRGALGSGEGANRDVQFLLLLRHGPLTPSDLGERAGCTRSATSRALGRLEAGGLVTRTPDPANRRQVRVALTREARRRVRTLVTRLQDYFGAGAPLVKEALDLLHLPASAAPAAPADALELVEELSRVGAAYVTEDEGAMAGYGIDTSSDRYALGILAYRGSVRPSQLADELHLTKSSVSGLLDRMEAVGLVTRRYGQQPGDRRVVEVALTPRGQRAAAERLAILDRRVDELGAALALTLG